MSMSKTISGKVRTAQKIVIYGPEGIGKSSLASKFPAPYFVDCEGGTNHLDVARIHAASIQEVKQVCAEIVSSKYKTLVIDTADWCEDLMIQAMLRRDKMNSIKDYGYGEGYKEAQNEFSRLLSAFSSVVNAGIHVVILAHAKIVKFEQPDAAASYDRWNLKLTKHCTPLLKEWADMVLFLNWDTRVATDAKTKKSRGVGGEVRKIHTSNSAVFDAKSRPTLPDVIEVGDIDDPLPEEITKAIAFDAKENAPAGLSTADLEDAAPAPSTGVELFEAEIASKGGANSEALINDFLIDRKQITEGKTWRDAPDDYLNKAGSHPKAFIKTMLEFRDARDAKAKEAGK